MLVKEPRMLWPSSCNPAVVALKCLRIKGEVDIVICNNEDDDFDVNDNEVCLELAEII